MFQQLTEWKPSRQSVRRRGQSKAVAGSRSAQYTVPNYKLAHLEFYHTREGAAFGQICQGCGSNYLWQLLHSTTGLQMGWWHLECCRFRHPEEVAATLDELFRQLLQHRQFEGHSESWDIQ